MKDELVLVDSEDNILGYEEKEKCHDGKGILHRAFSAFVFNDEGELLIQKRADGKRLWPGFWANSCCSHPRKGEGYVEAGGKRLMEELGFTCDLEPLFKFEYQAKYGEEGSENELDQVLLGKYNGEVKANPEEVAEYKWVKPDWLRADIEENSEKYAPWFKISLERVLEVMEKRK